MNLRRPDNKALSICAFSVLVPFLVPNVAVAQQGAPGMSFQATQMSCVSGFERKSLKKGPNGMVSKMVCKTPVLTCPKNSEPGVITITDPKVKNLGGGDNSYKFRFVYTCKYAKIAG